MASFLSNLLYQTVIYAYCHVQNVYRRCRKPFNLEEFKLACRNGNMLIVKQYHKDYPNKIDLKEAFSIAVNNNQTEVAKFCIDNEEVNKDEGLKVACANNHFGLAELMVQKGANINAGKRVCKSTNILRMLYRYEQKAELIN